MEDPGRAAIDSNPASDASESLPKPPFSGFLPEILLLVLTTAAGVWAAGRWLVPFGDPGGWWTLMHRLGNGERLYRDVFLQYTPLSPYLLAAAGRLFGLSPMSFLLLNWIPAILLGLLLLRAGRPYLGELERLAVAGLVLALGLFGPGGARLVLPYSPAAVHALIFSMLALLLLQRSSPRRSDGWVAGALAGLAFCSKQEIGLAVLAAICAPVLNGSPRGLRWLPPVLAGFVGVSGAGALVVLASASLQSLRLDSHFWPLAPVPEPWRYLSQLTTGLLIRDTPVRFAGAVASFVYFVALVAILGLIAGRDAWPRRWMLLAALALLIAFGAVSGLLVGRLADPLCLSTAVAFGVSLLAWRQIWRPGRDFLVAFGIFAGIVGIRTALAGRIGWSSYSGVTNVATALTWALFLFCFLPGIFRAGRLSAQATRKIWVALVLAVGTWEAWTGVRDLAGSSEVLVETPRGRVWVTEIAAPLFASLGVWLKPGDRALVLPEPNGIEALFKLQSASPYLYHMPGWLDARAEDALMRRFEKEPPDVVLWFRRSTWEFGVEPLGRGYGRSLAAWIEARYAPVASPPGAVILRKRASSG